MTPGRNSTSRDISIQEYDVLIKDTGSRSTAARSIPPEDWDWLHEQCLNLGDSPAFFRPVFRGGVHGLQARNYVGTVELPSGRQIEILPKAITDTTAPHQTRQIVLKMLRRVLRLSTYSWRKGSLATKDQPLHELSISLFLSEVERLVKRGLRSQYVQQEDEQPFLRGRLRIDKQLHRRPGSSPQFSIEYHEFLPDRPENRLIHSAILAVDRWTRDPENQRRARTLRFLFTDIPESRNHRQNLQLWSTDRSLIDYQGLKPWCELILSGQSPLFLSGSFSGLSFLFPMEQLFEKYVATVLKQQLPTDLRLIEQPSRHALVTHEGAAWFRLKPDLLIERQDRSIAAVLDTKWKRIDETLDNGKDKYGLSQSDFYQMAAYGQKYLSGAGDMFLIYPSSSSFDNYLPPFQFSSELRLWVVPFDLQTDELDLPISIDAITPASMQ